MEVPEFLLLAQKRLTFCIVWEVSPSSDIMEGWLRPSHHLQLG
jgi:hypothetical protein